MRSDYTPQEVNKLIAGWPKNSEAVRLAELKFTVMRLAAANPGWPLSYHLVTLYELAERMLIQRQTINIVELGVERGSSTFVFNALTELCAFHVGVDLIDRPLQVKFLYPDRFRFVKADTRLASTVECIGNVFGGKRERWCDYLFIDSNHSIKCAKEELNVWSKVLSPGALIVAHDTWMFGQKNPMLDYMEEWAAKSGRVPLTLSKQGHGLTVFIQK
jgi:hypothetical protein